MSTGVYGSIDIREGETQTYSDSGEPILEGDKIRFSQAPGGLLTPSEGVEGIAAYLPWNDDWNAGTLFGKWIDSKGNERFFYITTGTVTRA